MLGQRSWGSFVDEMVKMSDSAAPSLSGVPSPKPKAVATSSGSLKPQTQGTNYSKVYADPPQTSVSTAVGSKAMAPPPVRS